MIFSAAIVDRLLILFTKISLSKSIQCTIYLFRRSVNHALNTLFNLNALHFFCFASYGSYNLILLIGFVLFSPYLCI